MFPDMFSVPHSSACYVDEPVPLYINGFWFGLLCRRSSMATAASACKSKPVIVATIALPSWRQTIPLDNTD